MLQANTKIIKLKNRYLNFIQSPILNLLKTLSIKFFLINLIYSILKTLQMAYSNESTTILAGLSSTVKESSVFGLELATRIGVPFPSSQM